VEGLNQPERQFMKRILIVSAFDLNAIDAMIYAMRESAILSFLCYLQ
jgi:hypothetical protein